MNRLINVTLALLSIFGGVLAFRESSLNRDLSEEHLELAAESGYLDLSDFNKVYVVALPSEDPLHFRWRIYLPDKCNVIWKTSQWQDGSGNSAGPQDFIAQVRVRRNERGFVRVFEDLGSSTGVASLGGRELQEFLHDHWDDVDIHQLGSDGPVAVEPQEITTLVRLQLPKNLADEAKAVLPTRWARQVVPVLYQVHFGTEEAWQETESGKSAAGATDR